MNRELILKKPIAVFDLETTGVNTMTDKIVSISIRKIMPDKSREEFYSLVNPGIDIPESASSIHGITNEMVKDQPLLETIAYKIVDFTKGCDLAGFNCNYFDIPLLSMELARVNQEWPESDALFIDAGNLYKILNSRTLSSAYKFYTGKDLVGAHGADVDTMATLEVLFGMVSFHQELPVDVTELSLMSCYGKKRIDVAGCFAYNPEGKRVFTFGKNKDKIICMDNVEYLGWMFNKGDFHPDTKSWARKMYNEIMYPGQTDLPF